MRVSGPACGCRDAAAAFQTIALEEPTQLADTDDPKLDRMSSSRGKGEATEWWVTYVAYGPSAEMPDEGGTNGRRRGIQSVCESSAPARSQPFPAQGSAGCGLPQHVPITSRARYPPFTLARTRQKRVRRSGGQGVASSNLASPTERSSASDSKFISRSILFPDRLRLLTTFFTRARRLAGSVPHATRQERRGRGRHR
jgi:hypothetical protein